MNSFKLKRRGFTLIEMVLVLAVITILISVGVIIYTKVIDAANEKVCHLQGQSAIQLYKTYVVNGSEIDIDGTTGTKFLVKGNLLSKEYECPNGGVYTWKVNKKGNVSISCSIHGENEEEEHIKPSKTAIAPENPNLPSFTLGRWE